MLYVTCHKAERMWLLGHNHLVGKFTGFCLQHKQLCIEKSISSCFEGVNKEKSTLRAGGVWTTSTCSHQCHHKCMLKVVVKIWEVTNQVHSTNLTLQLFTAYDSIRYCVEICKEICAGLNIPCLTMPEGVSYKWRFSNL